MRSVSGRSPVPVFQTVGGVKRPDPEKGISIIADIPIYVAEDSADVWAHPEQFQMDEELRAPEGGGLSP